MGHASKAAPPAASVVNEPPARPGPSPRRRGAANQYEEFAALWGVFMARVDRDLECAASTDASIQDLARVAGVHPSPCPQWLRRIQHGRAIAALRRGPR